VKGNPCAIQATPRILRHPAVLTQPQFLQDFVLLGQGGGVCRLVVQEKECRLGRTADDEAPGGSPHLRDWCPGASNCPGLVVEKATQGLIFIPLRALLRRRETTTAQDHRS